MASNPPGRCCTIGTLHHGETTGKMIKIDHNLDAYLATPPEGKSNGAGIVFYTDVYGFWPNNKLVADSFAANGYTTIIPDLFNGDEMPQPPPPGFNILEWLAKGSDGNNSHMPEAVDPLAIAGIKALKDMGIQKIGAAGYCFGAKYVVRHYKSGIQVGYMAHPSFVTEEEVAAITGPLSIAAAETDSQFPAEKRHKSEEILVKTGHPYQINLYSGVSHGFAVRGEQKTKVERYAKEQAFLQAVSFFDAYLVGS